MISNAVNPNHDLYAQLQRASDHFNLALFDGKLPQPMLTLQRKKGAVGYFSAKRWAHTSGVKVSEIALNPLCFANRSLLQFFQTIVHEQCHLWQHEFGTPSRPGYHNAEWSEKMQEIGLMPSSTGEPGGNRTGQKMSDFPSPKGRFIAACVDLMENGFALAWVDQGFSAGTTMRSSVIADLRLRTSVEASLCTSIGAKFEELHSQFDPEVASQKRKVKYRCDSCKANAWGKSGLEIQCVPCGIEFTRVYAAT